jgi:tRNA-Thr(GGU) m(6)t(6)A37 methyltransferase TsaA
VNIQPIGVIKSTASEAKDEGWGSVISEIHLKQDLATGLQGLDQFSHLIVIFLMHQATFNAATDLVRRPRGRDDMPELGIFAQRAKHRPVPIGITAVELAGVADNVVTVRGLDAIDGTPVLDLKPYFPAFDKIDDAAVPDWAAVLMKDYF